MYKYICFALKSRYLLSTRAVSFALNASYQDHYGTITHGYCSNNQLIPLAIDTEVFTPGLSYLNYFLENQNLYLSNAEVRNLLMPCQKESEIPKELFSKYHEFGLFRIVMLPKHYEKLKKS